MKTILALALVALVASQAAAQPVAPSQDRTVAYCARLFAEVGAQRNAEADQVAQLRAQVAMLEADLTIAQARVAQFEKAAPAPKK